jgi:hypothetical protein
METVEEQTNIISSQQSFHPSKNNRNTLKVSRATLNNKQYHFDQIGKDPECGWDANAMQSG